MHFISIENETIMSKLKYTAETKTPEGYIKVSEEDFNKIIHVPYPCHFEGDKLIIEEPTTPLTEVEILRSQLQMQEQAIAELTMYMFTLGV